MSAHNFVDLTGQKFGLLTVIGFNSDTQKWQCKCDCGNPNIVEKKAGHLHLKNRVHSCGCINKMKFIDITGQRFGHLVALEYNKNLRSWKCQCDCGNVCYKKSGHLRGGLVTRCGNNCTINDKLIDISNRRFGKIEVKKYLGENKWLCQCDCGREHIALGVNIRNGAVRSCGKCIASAFIDIKGHRFGKLIAEEYQGHGIWKCKCDCGSTCYKNSYDLRERGAKSCGCGTKDSIKETEVLNFIKSIYSGNVISHNKNILINKELDIYIPEKKLAIEFNGSYWHSDIHKNIRYHQEKSLECIKNGIRLIHIFEYEWDNEEKQQKIKSLINDILCNTRKIYARSITVKEIDNSEAFDFLNKYHMQGYVKCSIIIGAYYNEQLIGIMSFSKPRFNSNYQYELIRLCWKNNINVVGGSNKLFKYFLKRYEVNNIICYTDLSKFNGNTYLKLGFNVDENEPITRPNYVWVPHHGTEVLSRYQTQKHKLLEKNMGTEEETEDEIMTKNGYYKVYDSGNIKFIFNNLEDNHGKS